jgi:hypothetical protein
MIKQKKSLKRGSLQKVISKLLVAGVLVASVFISQTAGAISKKDYQTLTNKLIEQGLYKNKDGSIGGVFNLSDGKTLRVFKIDTDGNLWGVVKFTDSEYKIAVFSYEEVMTFIERKESVKVD